MNIFVKFLTMILNDMAKVVFKSILQKIIANGNFRESTING